MNGIWTPHRTERQNSDDSAFTMSIRRMLGDGKTRSEVIAAHSFGWRERAKSRIDAILHEAI